MRNLIIGTATALSLLSGSAVTNAAPAAPPAQLLFGGDRVGDTPSLEQVQFFFSGRNYCWYFNGWRGPGYYWCGYAWRHGLGWGGGRGWNGWYGHGGGRGYGHGGGYGGHVGGDFGGGRSGGGHEGSGRVGGGGGHGGGEHHGR